MRPAREASLNADRGASDTDGFITPVGCPESGVVAGQHDDPQGDEQHAGDTERNPLGQGDNEQDDQSTFDGIDYPLNIDKIVERFKAHPSIRMRPISTQKVYTRMFVRFAEAKGLENHTRRQIAGPRGKRMVLEHIVDNIPLRSRRTTLAGIEKVWKFALDLPWPIDNGRDIGKLPRVRRRQVPPDSKVRSWYEAMQHEPNPYLRFLWLALSQSGQRPSTIAKLRWGHIRYDDQDVPCDIRVNGADSGLKTYADVAWWLPPDVRTALIEMRKSLGDPGEDTPILPWMDRWGNVKPGKETKTELIRGQMYKLKEKYGLPQLLPVDLRHWVDGRCRDAGLKEQARAYLMGHEQEIHNMGDQYDCRDIETNLERQRETFPYGPLGIFSQAKVEIMGDLPGEIVASLIDYRDNKIAFAEVMNLLDQWRLSAKQESIRPVQ